MNMEDYLRQFRLSEPDPKLRERMLDSLARSRPARLRLPAWVWYAAASLLLAVGGAGLWHALGPRHDAGNDNSVTPAVAFLNGRGRLVPVGDDTRFTLVDAGLGQVRLERGEVYVELAPEAGLKAEIETPAGTAVARGTRFYAQCDRGAGLHANLFLAVAILGGVVEVTNAHGRAVGDAGEVVLAEQGSAPEKHSGTSDRSASRFHGFCPFASALGLIVRPEVQAELQLSDRQKASLQRPEKNEAKEICAFFRGLRSVPRSEWSTKTSEFCAAQQQRVAAVLDAGQQQRLRQIGFQQEGFFAVARKAVADELKLTAGQSQQIEADLKAFGEAYRDLLAKASNGEMGKKMAALEQQAAAKVSSRLTEAQKEQWRLLLGAPFALDRRGPYHRHD